MLRWILLLSLIVLGLLLHLRKLQQSEHFDALQDCMNKQNQDCAALEKAVNDATPSQYTQRYEEWKKCLSDSYSKCACSKKKEINQTCFDSMQYSIPGTDRVFGCYDPTLSAADMEACFTDPVKFLCKDDATSQRCMDIQAECPDPCQTMEDLFKPVADI